MHMLIMMNLAELYNRKVFVVYCLRVYFPIFQYLFSVDSLFPNSVTATFFLSEQLAMIS